MITSRVPATVIMIPDSFLSLILSRVRLLTGSCVRLKYPIEDEV
jgi:hypothetical protein